MLAITIQATGKTFDDLALAIDQIYESLNDGFTSGANGNDSGSYTFEVTGEEEGAE